MLDSLIDLISDAWWTYPFLFLFALLDSIIPIVPSEKTGGHRGRRGGRSGGLDLPAVILVAAAGAICGDNIADEIGKRARPWIERRFSGRRPPGASSGPMSCWPVAASGSSSWPASSRADEPPSPSPPA